MLNKRADKLELLRIAEAVALEKSIDKELIRSSMESGIAKAAKSKFGQENEITVQIDRDSGDIGVFRKLIVVDKPENTNTEISLNEAQKIWIPANAWKLAESAIILVLCSGPCHNFTKGNKRNTS